VRGTEVGNIGADDNGWARRQGTHRPVHAPAEVASSLADRPPVPWPWIAAAIVRCDGKPRLPAPVAPEAAEHARHRPAIERPRGNAADVSGETAFHPTDSRFADEDDEVAGQR